MKIAGRGVQTGRQLKHQPTASYDNEALSKKNHLQQTAIKRSQSAFKNQPTGREYIELEKLSIV